jgi:hypothetical protein
MSHDDLAKTQRIVAEKIEPVARNIARLLGFVKKYAWAHAGVTAAVLFCYSHFVTEPRAKADAEISARLAAYKLELSSQLQSNNDVLQGKINMVSKQVDDLSKQVNIFLQTAIQRNASAKADSQQGQ